MSTALSAPNRTLDPAFVATLARLQPAARSALARWLERHAAELAPTLAESGRTNWRAMAAQFASSGVTDARGKAPTPRCVRDTWRKVAAGALSRTRHRMSG
jgi:hypothetical protein